MNAGMLLKNSHLPGATTSDLGLKKVITSSRCWILSYHIRGKGRPVEKKVSILEGDQKQ